MKQPSGFALGLALAMIAASLAAQSTATTTATTAGPGSAPAGGTAPVAELKSPPATTEPAPPAAPPQSDLVKAAKKSSPKRKKARISITDRDLRQTTGKLTVVSQSGTPVAPGGLTAAESAQMENDEKRRNREATEGRITRAQAEVAALEKELGKLEEDYYGEDNPDYRDRVIENRYDQTKSQLEKARHELTLARDELSKYQ